MRESGDEGGGGEGLQGGGSNGVDVGDEGFDGVGHEGAEDEAAELGVVIALVEEYGFFSDHSFFAAGESGLEEMSFGEQDELDCVWVSDHHAWTPQHLCLEYRTIPAVQ